MTDQAAAAETNADQAQAPAAKSAGSGTRHVVVAGAALATMAFVLGLWLIRGGSVDMLLGETPPVATAASESVGQDGQVAAVEPPAQPMASAPAPLPAQPVATAQDAKAEGRPPQPAVAAAAAPHGMPVYVVPNGVVNPLTMLHDPAYYQQWARVGATFANPFAYQQIMTLMMQHAMQAWGMGPPITVALDNDAAPRG